MKWKRIAALLLAVLLSVGGGAVWAAEEAVDVSHLHDLPNKVGKAHELPAEDDTSYILPSFSTWQPYAKGGEKHVLISSSADWYVESCPEWVELYFLQSKVDLSTGMTEWELVPMEIGTAEGGKTFYPNNANVFMVVEQNDSQEDRRGVILLMLEDGTRGKISIAQARHVEELEIEIVKPCADAVDFVMAGYPTDIEVEMSNAEAGRVRILDDKNRVLYEAEFSQDTYSFEYTFDEGCYVICAEATGEEGISESHDGYVCETVTITSSELEVIEEIGVTRKYLEYIKAREGKRNKPYKDSAGNWTIGYGHLIDQAQAEKYASGWSDKTCEEQLMYDLKKHADIMRERLGEELYSQLTPNQFDALVSLEFNACGRAVESQYRLGQCLLKLDTVEDWRVINGFITWHGINDGTVDVLGLYYRRMEEARMFLYGDYTTKYNWPQPWWLNIGANGTGASIHDVPSSSSWYTSIIPSLSTSLSLIETDEYGAASYITIQSSRSWSIEIDESCTWVAASSYRGSNGNIVEITVEENGGEARHGVVKVMCGATVRTIHVHQGGAAQQ